MKKIILTLIIMTITFTNIYCDTGNATSRGPGLDLFTFLLVPKDQHDKIKDWGNLGGFVGDNIKDDMLSQIQSASLGFVVTTAGEVFPPVRMVLSLLNTNSGPDKHDIYYKNIMSEIETNRQYIYDNRKLFYDTMVLRDYYDEFQIVNSLSERLNNKPISEWGKYHYDNAFKYLTYEGSSAFYDRISAATIRFQNNTVARANSGEIDAYFLMAPYARYIENIGFQLELALTTSTITGLFYNGLREYGYEYALQEYGKVLNDQPEDELDILETDTFSTVSKAFQFLEKLNELNMWKKASDVRFSSVDRDEENWKDGYRLIRYSSLNELIKDEIKKNGYWGTISVPNPGGSGSNTNKYTINVINDQYGASIGKFDTNDNLAIDVTYCSVYENKFSNSHEKYQEHKGSYILTPFSFHVFQEYFDLSCTLISEKDGYYLYSTNKSIIQFMDDFERKSGFAGSNIDLVSLHKYLEYIKYLVHAFEPTIPVLEEWHRKFIYGKNGNYSARKKLAPEQHLRNYNNTTKWTINDRIHLTTLKKTYTDIVITDRGSLLILNGGNKSIDEYTSLMSDLKLSTDNIFNEGDNKIMNGYLELPSMFRTLTVKSGGVLVIPRSNYNALKDKIIREPGAKVYYLDDNGNYQDPAIIMQIINSLLLD